MNPGTSSSNGEGASSLADAPLPHTGDAGEEDGVKGAAIEVESTKKAEGKDSVMVDINLVDTIPDCSEHKVDALQKSNGAGLGPCAFLIPRCIRYNRENHPPEATGLALDAYAM